MAAKRILVVDDEPSILKSTALLLGDLGFEATVASDPAEILAVARQTKPDILLQDVRMPGLDLGDLVAKLRADPETRHIRIILFSASLDLESLRERVGAAGFLEKPFRPTNLLAAIEAATEA